MECPQCFCVGEHRCTRPYNLPGRFHCEVCSGLMNPLLNDGSCLWCFCGFHSKGHIETCPQRPVNSNIYEDNKCYCSSIGVMVEELLTRQQGQKCIELNCPMLEWEMFKDKHSNLKNLYKNKIIFCTDGVTVE